MIPFRCAFCLKVVQLVSGSCAVILMQRVLGWCRKRRFLLAALPLLQAERHENP
jgi:hypothetical protein